MASDSDLSVSMTKGRVFWLGCVVAVLAILVVVAPSAFALTTVPAGSGETSITSSSVSCGPMGAPGPNSYPHHNGDSVRVPMDAAWHDSRSGGSASRKNSYKIDATYGGQHYIQTYDHFSAGNDDSSASFYVDVSSVMTGTTISVTFSAAVYDSSQNNLCPNGSPATISTTYSF